MSQQGCLFSSTYEFIIGLAGFRRLFYDECRDPSIADFLAGFLRHLDCAIDPIADDQDRHALAQHAVHHRRFESMPLAR